MTELIKLLIDKLPMKLVAVVLGIVLAWFGVLTGVALVTHRAVDFFPPRIGTDMAIVAELQALTKQVDSLKENEQKTRGNLLELVAKARDKSIAIQQSGNVFGSMDASLTVTKYEELLRAEEEKYLSETKKLQEQIRELSNKL